MVARQKDLSLHRASPDIRRRDGALLAEDGMPLNLSEQQLKIIMTSACG
jgi:hypothetical protein